MTAVDIKLWHAEWIREAGRHGVPDSSEARTGPVREERDETIEPSDFGLKITFRMTGRSLLSPVKQAACQRVGAAIEVVATRGRNVTLAGMRLVARRWFRDPAK